MSNNDTKHYVTLVELDKKLDEKPGRWEVRALILIGLVLGQIVPVVEVGKAALSIF